MKNTSLPEDSGARGRGIWMDIVIMNRTNARKESFKRNRPDTAIISITDHILPFNTFANARWIKSVLKLKFDDVTEGSSFGFCITDEDAAAILAFVLNVKDTVQRLIVHCEAGVSRSAGVAAAIMKVLYGDDMPIFNNTQYCPNMTCYKKVLLAFTGAVDEEDLRNKERLNRKLWFDWLQ